MDEPVVIVVAAVAILDAAGRMLTVRKRGTTRFMNPGGKPETGETPLQTAIREVDEELGLRLDASSLTPLGVWSADAANEPGATVVAHAFRAVIDGAAAVSARAEIDEVRWVDPHDIARWTGEGNDDALDEYAPLLVRHFVPALLPGSPISRHPR